MALPIDYLLEALQSSSDLIVDDNDGNVSQNTVNFVEADNTTNPHINLSQDQTTLLAPSSTGRRSKLIIRNLSSSSLKRKVTKPVHCKYCSKFKSNRKHLEEHLRIYETCSLLYQRELKVTELDAVLVKIFRCLGCSKTGNFQLKTHLGKPSNKE